jgi:metal-dependent HD superfamily phosphatase/phosphodiesterase
MTKKKHHHVKKALAVTAGIAATAAASYLLRGRSSPVAFHESVPDIHASALNQAFRGVNDWR